MTLKKTCWTCQDFKKGVKVNQWRKSRGMGDCIPPIFFWGVAYTNIPPPPLFEDKITLNLSFIVKKLTFLTVELLKTQKLLARSARSHTNVFWDSIFAVLPYMYSILDFIYVKKGVE